MQRIKKQINLECNQLPLIDESILEQKRAQEKEVAQENCRLGEEVRREIAQFDLKINAEIE